MKKELTPWQDTIPPGGVIMTSLRGIRIVYVFRWIQGMMRRGFEGGNGWIRIGSQAGRVLHFNLSSHSCLHYCFVLCIMQIMFKSRKGENGHAPGSRFRKNTLP